MTILDLITGSGLTERFYAPDRLSQDTQEEGNRLGGENLQAATDVCLRCHEAIRDGQEPEYTDLRGADLRAGRNRLSKKVRPKEQLALYKWAEANGKLLDNSAFTRLWKAQGSKGETENQVYYDEPSQRWYKRNNLDYHTSYLEFLYRIALHNQHFPEAPLRLEGFVVDRDPDGTRMLKPVISQPNVQVERGAKRPEVEPLMRNLGFVRVGDSDDYYNEQTGIRVEDMHDENVLLGKDGVIYVVDPVVYLDDRGKQRRLAAHSPIGKLKEHHSLVESLLG